MTKTILIRGGILTLNESMAICPHCERKISSEEIEEKFMKQDKSYMKMKCKCKRFIEITSDMRGDWHAYALSN